MVTGSREDIHLGCIVHYDPNGIGLSETEVGGKLESEGGVSATMFSDIPSVDNQTGDSSSRSEADEDPFASPCLGNFYLFEVVADPAIIV